jgi:hypothetical protein
MRAPVWVGVVFVSFRACDNHDRRAAHGTDNPPPDRGLNAFLKTLP